MAIDSAGRFEGIIPAPCKAGAKDFGGQKRTAQGELWDSYDCPIS